MQSVNGQTYSYDPNGNVTSSQQKQLSDMTYDPFTMLTMRVSETGQSQHVEFQYGGNKQRVLKMEQVGDSPVPHSVLYLHGLNDYPLTEKYSEQGVINDKKYVYGPSGLVAVVQGASRHLVLRDHLGSARVVLNDSNQAVSWYNFTPFGDMWRSTVNTDIAYRFTGQEIDEELGLHNFRARMYDSWLGRFYAMDPANEGFGPYSYVFGNPVSFVDPTGRQLGKPEDRQLEELQKYEKFLELLAESVFRNASIKQAVWSRVAGESSSSNTTASDLHAFLQSEGRKAVEKKRLAGFELGKEISPTDRNLWLMVALTDLKESVEQYYNMTVATSDNLPKGAKLASSGVIVVSSDGETRQAHGITWSSRELVQNSEGRLGYGSHILIAPAAFGSPEQLYMAIDHEFSHASFNLNKPELVARWSHAANETEAYARSIDTAIRMSKDYPSFLVFMPGLQMMYDRYNAERMRLGR